jgi:TRAP-type C4-dicarboxylate transport system substrate-binding protein
VRVRAWPAAVIALLIALVAGCGGSDDDGAEPARGWSAYPAVYRDAVGDGGSLPDIRQVKVTSTDEGRLSFRVALGNRDPKEKTAVDLWLDTDADPETGNTSFEGADGADYMVSAFTGFTPPARPYCGEFHGGCLSKSTPDGWVPAAARTARVTETANGFTLSIDRRDLGNTKELNFAAVRGAADRGLVDRAPGRGTFNYSLALHGPRPDTSRKARNGGDKAGGDDESKPVVLTLGTHDYLETDPIASAFVTAVKRASDGSLKLDVRQGWRFYDRDYERATISDAVHHDLDIAIVGARAWDNAGVTSFRALLAPLLVDSFELEGRVLEGPLVERMLAGVEARGLVGLAVLPGALRRPLGVSRPLLGPGDYVGAAIAVRPGGVAKATFKALGGSSSDFRSDEISLFDGSELDPTTILNNRYDRHAKALTGNVVLWPRATTVVMDRKAFDSLTSEQQEVLRSAGRAALQPLLETLQSDERDSLTSLCDHGLHVVSASPAQRARLRKAVQPVYDQLERDSLTRELIGEIEKLRSGLPGSEPLRCGKAHSRQGPTALDGRWRADLSAKALAAAGASKQDVDLAQGPALLDLGAGRWTVRIARAARIIRGRYTVDGSVLRLTIDSCAPARACTLDQVTEYRWNVYRDKLSLSRSHRYALPALVAEPWTRAP